MKIHLATDHAGLEHKEAVKVYLLDLAAQAGQDIEVVDHGAMEFVAEDDYPDYIKTCAESVVVEPESMGIIFGASGEGEAMVANRVSGIRATVYYGGSTDIITLSREHNNANILSLGARFLSPDEAIQAVALWLATPFSNDERHVRRISKF